MHRIDTDGNIAGTWSDGDPSTGVQGTTMSADWLNDMQGNLVDVVESAGIVLEKGNLLQLKLAIAAMIATAKAAAIAATRTPVGTLGQFDRLTAPAGGWLAYNGAEHLKADYPDLVALWTAEGRLVAGSTAAHFIVPKREGYFARSTSTDAIVDPNGPKTAASAAMPDTFKSHVHSVSPPAATDDTASGLTTTGTGGAEAITAYNTAAAGGLETAPKHVFVLWCVKT